MGILTIVIARLLTRCSTKTAVVFAVCFVMFGINMSLAISAERVALVIGNSNYTNAGLLNNPTNDANDVAEALRKLDFKVMLGTDTNYNEMRKLIQEFSVEVANAEVATFYYAGHGIAVDGENYLLPVDAELNSKTDLDFQTLSLSLVQRQMEQSASTRLIFLDACRNNPLTQNWTSSSRALTSRGLAIPTRKTKGTYIAFATEPGSVALDGDGNRNSPFSTAFLKHVASPGLELASLMKKVRRDVTVATNDRQIPWSNSGLIGDFYFNTDKSESDDPVAAFRNEQKAWQAISQTRDVGLLKSFISEYPNGNFIGIAQDRLRILSRENEQTETALLAVRSERPAKEPVKIPAQISDGLNPLLDGVAHRPITECDRLTAQELDLDALFWDVGTGIGEENKAKAIKACREAVKKYPDDLTLRYQLGLLLEGGDDAAKKQASDEIIYASERGYPAAMARHASAVMHGWWGEEDDVAGLKLLHEAAEKGAWNAINDLAFYYEVGIYVKEDAKKSDEFYKRIVTMNMDILKQRQDPIVLLDLSNKYAQGSGVQKNTDIAEKYYREAETVLLNAAQKDNKGAMFVLGSSYLYTYITDDIPGLSAQPEKAKQWLGKAAVLGSLDAQYELDKMAKEAGITPPDGLNPLLNGVAHRPITECDRLASWYQDLDAIHWSAVDLLTADAENADKAVVACRSALDEYPDDLTLRYQLASALSFDEATLEQAAKEMKIASDRGYRVAMGEYASWLYYGRGVTEDKGAGIKLYAKAADLGDFTSLNQLSIHYGYLATPTDRNKAREYSKQLVELYKSILTKREDPQVMLLLASAYIVGAYGLFEGDETKDLARALLDKVKAIYLELSNKGNIGAMLLLAEEYHHDSYSKSLPGYSNQPEEAKKWWRKAAELGSLSAKNRLKELGIKPSGQNPLLASDPKRPITECDRLASWNWDLDAIYWSIGSQLRTENLDQALQACKSAVAEYPDDLTLRFQLAAVLSSNEATRVQAAKEMKIASDGGYRAAMGEYSHWLEGGFGVTKDEAAGLALRKKAAELGDLNATSALGTGYSYGSNQDTKKMKKYEDLQVEIYLDILSKRRDPEVMQDLAYKYSSHDGVTKDEVLAKTYFRQSMVIYLEHAKKGNIGAMLYLARGYDNEYLAGYIRGISHKPEEAKTWWKKAADLGSLDAERQLEKLAEASN